ncbi:hypothetical protein [Actinoallomurus sp. CA-150999]|uniref:hypothetical protein n=1 Tax=Actinoallomurus sp. CA-150999 TaxID=3239887 RepID=UPI003D919F01
MAILATTAAAAACTGGGRARADRPHSPGTLVLSGLWIEGSPAPPGRTPLPAFALYGDGTLLFPGGTVGALPTIRAFHLTRSAADRLYERALDAGLATPRHYDRQAPDAGVLIVTLVSNTRRAVTRVVLPDRSDHGRRGAIARLGSFDPRTLARKDQVRPPDTYRYTRLAVVTGGNLGAPERAWPFSPLSRSSASADHGRCMIVTGEELRKVRDLAASASPNTLWAGDDGKYQLSFRPLLPAEAGCADLG